MQTSAKHLSLKKQTQLNQQFISLIGDLQHPEEVKGFIQNFFTETEQAVFSKRVAILWELNQGKSYQNIKDSLKVSSATISTVSEMKNSLGILQAIEKIKFDKKIDKFLDFFRL